MVDREKVIKGLAACMPQNEDEAAIGCDGCPYNGHPCGGDYQDNDHVNLPVALIEDIRALLKEQEPSKREIKHAISNVDIPKDIDEEQFFAVLAQQYAALARLYGEDVTIYSPS